MSEESDGEDALSAAVTDSKNEEKLSEFLEDPEKAIKVFMSSYSWAKGYVWYISRLRNQRSRLIPPQVGI